jgi:hypothetical protein
VSLDRGRLVASLATQEAEDDYSDKGRASPHYVSDGGEPQIVPPGVMPERLRKAATGYGCAMDRFHCPCASDCATAKTTPPLGQEPERLRKGGGELR